MAGRLREGSSDARGPLVEQYRHQSPSRRRSDSSNDGGGLWVAPMMGLPAMNPAAMLAGAMGGSMALGWTEHLMIGTILALIYAAA